MSFPSPYHSCLRPVRAEPLPDVAEGGGQRQSLPGFYGTNYDETLKLPPARGVLATYFCRSVKDLRIKRQTSPGSFGKLRSALAARSDQDCAESLSPKNRDAPHPAASARPR
ncbi:protein of unknown function [Methylorubrum extorquens]|uniref:Uncharacterized protein n=1 Tax=Methylorubrum extorquens TaxID=408 RepID=A0A2N9ATV1_METEX|nr:protein of unknown function [Methylorubrum extorquens]